MGKELLCTLALTWCLGAWSQCDGVRYRYRIFEEVSVSYEVIYGSNVGSSGSVEVLDMDKTTKDMEHVSYEPI